ncbi:MAG: hypothetical protein Q8L22_12935 [Reyranella sp.]|nr:hypothetical protein [Reyranella sp.]
MLRFLMRGLLSPSAIIVINVLILIPLILATIDVSHSVLTNPDLKEPIDIIEDMGVIMIGWGVALEERGEMRRIFGIVDPARETWQAHVDHICHHVGIGQLVFGLMIEICLSIVRLPARIIDTKDFDEHVVGVSIAFMIIGAYILLRHIYALVMAMLRPHAVAGVASK